jgi:hypothetical protein
MSHGALKLSVAVMPYKLERNETVQRRRALLELRSFRRIDHYATIAYTAA